VLVPSERTWAISNPLSSGWVAEYHGCNLSGEDCVLLGVGHTEQAGSPLVVDHRVIQSGRMQVRVCWEATLGTPEPNCGEFSDPGVPFQYEPTLEPSSVLSVPPLLAEDPTPLSPGDTLVVPLDVPYRVAPPFTAELRVHVAGSNPIVRVELREGSAQGTLLFEGGCNGCPPDSVWDVTEALNEPSQLGFDQVVTVVEAVAGTVVIGGGDPAHSSSPAPHLWAFSWRGTLTDADGDGVPEDGDGSGAEGDVPCASSTWLGCDDNCPAQPNRRQFDRDRDGVGDLCDLCPLVAGNKCDLALGNALRPKSKTDCYLEWRMHATPLPTDRKGVPSTKVTCHDGDPGCDFDTIPGQCTFRLGLCLNQDDSRLPNCAPQGVDELQILGVRPPNSSGAARARLEAAIAAASLPNRQVDWCGEPFEAVVPIGARGAGKLRMAVRAIGTPEEGRRMGRRDADRVLLRCLRQ
jgi:hypothetical protein